MRFKFFPVKHKVEWTATVHYKHFCMVHHSGATHPAKKALHVYIRPSHFAHQSYSFVHLSYTLDTIPVMLFFQCQHYNSVNKCWLSPVKMQVLSDMKCTLTLNLYTLLWISFNQKWYFDFLSSLRRHHCSHCEAWVLLPQCLSAYVTFNPTSPFKPLSQDLYQDSQLTSSKTPHSVTLLVRQV